jgi:hypothetical protein
MAPRGSSSSSSSMAGGFHYVLSHGLAGSSGSVYEQNNQVWQIYIVVEVCTRAEQQQCC